MKIDEALKIVKKAQKWRRGDERVKIPCPTKYGLALDILINFCENHKKLVSSFAENTKLKNELHKLQQQKHTRTF